MIFGAASAIAKETALKFASDQCDLFLADIDEEKLKAVSRDILTRYKDVRIFLKKADALEFASHKSLIEEAAQAMGGLDVVLVAHGTLPDQEKIRYDIEAIAREIEINFLGAASVASAAAEFFEKQGRGNVAVISSVAGDRGRQSNYVYGSAKGGLTRFLEGLRNRVYKSGVVVTTIKPGLVDTPMTARFEKNFLYSSPKKVGEIIYSSVKKGKDVVYAPGFWRYVMLAIIHIPEGVFKKLKL